MTASIRQFCVLVTVPILGMVALSTVLGSDSNTGGRTQAAPCPGVMNFSVGGVGDPASVHTPGVPAGPRTNVPWPATVDDNAQRVGLANLTNAVNSFRAQCPNSHVTTVGYSGGAQIAGDWRDRNPGMRNTNVILVSDPRAPGGVASVLPSIPFWWTNQGPRPASPIPTSNVCRENDPICNMGNPLEDPIGAAAKWIFGGYPREHLYGPGTVNPAPGNHTPPPVQPMPIPQIKAPVKMPTPRQLSPVEPFVSKVTPQAWTPPAVQRGTAARNVGEVVPPALAGFVPPQLFGIPLPH